jgi:hypothetical protein
MVTFLIQEPNMYVQAGMPTDCGKLVGAVDEHSSTVDVLNGQPAHERWAGQLSLE